MKISFGAHIPIHGAYDYEAFSKTSMLADKLGYDFITVGDHFFLPSGSYERMGGDPDRPDKLDAWVALATLAVDTKRLKLGTRVSPVPFYLPSRLAKV
ncbi:MAG: LLM class flavin-dependent oxidoreductase, partial [Candidatus Bathyarchaeota archaeon]|nr:LLM class flavin-dependent oxidoreductase [Candidatus Bathyarchaeota archaeon]